MHLHHVCSQTGHVSDKSNAVNAKLQKRRDHIEELQQVQALLAKLQAVFELPKRMKAALEEDALGTAVDFYAEALPLLKKYGHRGTFRCACWLQAVKAWSWVAACFACL